MKAAERQTAEETALATKINLGIGLTPDESLVRDITKLVNRIDKLLVPGDSLQCNSITPKIEIIDKEIRKGLYFVDLDDYPKKEIKSKNNSYLSKKVDWILLEKALHNAIAGDVDDYVWPVRITEEFQSEKRTQEEKTEKTVKSERIRKILDRNKQPVLPGKWRQKPYGIREYDHLKEYYITKSIPEKVAQEVQDLLKTPLDGFVGQAYNYDDHKLTQDWMLSFYDNKVSVPSDEDVAKTQIEGLLEIMVNKVENRVCTESGVLRKDPVGLGPDLKEVPVWGIDCFTRRMIEIALEDKIPEEKRTSQSVKFFIERLLLPAINAQAPDVAHNMTKSLEYLLESSTISKLHAEYATSVLASIEENGLDNFRIHPKGTGVICTNPNGIPPHVFITEYLGELYPSYRWCERLEVIEQAQKHFELKPTLPDFYNILLERPRQDPAGYGLMYVDASQKANMGSSCSHSCDANCTSLVVARNGKLVIVLTTNRHVYYGEELTMDYYSITFSDIEWRSAICLCGKSECRGSFLRYATQDDLQQVLNQNCGPLWRYASLLRSCAATSLNAEDQAVLLRHGMSTAALGNNPPVWMKKFAVDNLKFVEYERKGLPCALLRPKNGVPSSYTFLEADMDARSVMEQRIQSLVCCYSMVTKVLDNHSEKSGNNLPLGIYKSSEAIQKVWDILQTIPALIDDHLLHPTTASKKKGPKKSIEKSELSTDETSTTAAPVSKKASEALLSETFTAITAILTEEIPKTMSALTNACMNIRKLLLTIEQLSTNTARLGQLADILVFWAYTSNYSYAKEYNEFESGPITVVARELGTNILKSQLNKSNKNTTSKRRSNGGSSNASTTTTSESVTTEKILKSSASVVSMDCSVAENMEVTTTASTTVTVEMTEGSVVEEVNSVSPVVDSPVKIEQSSESVTTVSNSVTVTPPAKKLTNAELLMKDLYLQPNDTVFTGTMKYPSLFVFWQLMGWYNAGTDDKCTAPNLFGSVQLPTPACCFGASESPYTNKHREMLIDVLKNDKSQMMPWSPALIKSFNISKCSSPALFGSPMLDAALGLVDAATKVHATLQGRDPNAKRVRDYSNKKDLKALADDAAFLAKNTQPDCIIPPETNTSWIQCDLCQKWRRLAWHVDADSLPEAWDCSMNTWDADAASCSVPQDAYDTEKESTISFKAVVQNSDDFTVGSFRDVYCTMNMIYYEANIMKVQQPKKEGDPLKLLFHFKGWNHKHDEWIPSDSDRIHPHNMYTNPCCKGAREQEEWQGVTGITVKIVDAYKPHKRKSGEMTTKDSKRNKKEVSSPEN